MTTDCRSRLVILPAGLGGAVWGWYSARAFAAFSWYLKFPEIAKSGEVLSVELVPEDSKCRLRYWIQTI